MEGGFRGKLEVKKAGWCAVLLAMTSHCSQYFICSLTFTPHEKSESSVIALILHKMNLSPAKIKTKPKKISNLHRQKVAEVGFKF